MPLLMQSAPTKSAAVTVAVTFFSWNDMSTWKACHQGNKTWLIQLRTAAFLPCFTPFWSKIAWCNCRRKSNIAVALVHHIVRSLFCATMFRCHRLPCILGQWQQVPLTTTSSAVLLQVIEFVFHKQSVFMSHQRFVWQKQSRCYFTNHNTESIKAIIFCLLPNYQTVFLSSQASE